MESHHSGEATHLPTTCVNSAILASWRAVRGPKVWNFCFNSSFVSDSSGSSSIYTNSTFLRMSSCALFASIASSSDPFESHLFGKIKDVPKPAIEAPPPMFQFQFPIPIPPQYEKRMRSPKRSHSDSSMTSDRSMPETMDISSRPISPVSPKPVGLGIFTPIDFPVEPPMSGLSSRTTSRPASRPGTAHSSMRRPFTSYSTTSLVNYPYQHHRRNHSTTSLPGFTPVMPIVRPPPVITVDSTWKALHPPAYQFRHFSSAYGPIVRPGMTAAFSTIRAIPQSPSLGLSGSRTPSVRSGSVYHNHSRSRSTGFVPMAPTRGSSKSSSSESGTFLRSRLNHLRSASDPNDMQFPQRGADIDLAIRLEQKLAEVKARLERQKSQSTANESDNSNSNASTNTDQSRSDSQRRREWSALKKSRSAVDLTTPSSLWLRHGHRRTSSCFDPGEARSEQLHFHAF